MVLVRPFTFGFHVVTPYKVVIKTPCMRPLDFFSGTSMIRHHCGVPNIYPLLTGRLKGNRLSLAHWEQTHHIACWLHSRLICVISMKHVHSFGARVKNVILKVSADLRTNEGSNPTSLPGVSGPASHPKAAILHSCSWGYWGYAISHGERVGIHQSSSIFPA